MARFRKKPVVVEARQWASEEDVVALQSWINSDLFDGTACDYDPELAGPTSKDGEDWGLFTIDTLESPHEVTPFDWIIRGVQGEFYPCKPDIFDLTYEEVYDD